MTDVNPITGDSLISKTNTKEYEDGYDRIFKQKVDLHTTVEKEAKRPPERKAQQWVLGSEGYFRENSCNAKKILLGSVQEEEGCKCNKGG